MVVTLLSEVARGVVEHGSVRLVFASADRLVTTTVGGLVADAEHAAGELQGRGVRAGDVVAVRMPNSYECAVAQTAVVLCGAVLLPIVHIYGPREVDFILRQSGAVLFPELTGRAEKYVRPDVAVTDRALLVYTSGTTADPKGVQHSHASLLAEVHSRQPAPGRHLALFPSGHVAGLLGLLRILIHGCETVVLDRWEPARAARLIDEHALANGVGAPVHLAGLLDERDRGAATLETLREFMVGAAGVPPALIERADRAGIAAYRAYGSSEHPTVSSGAPNDPLVKRATTDGRVIAGNEVRLVDDDGTDVAEGEIVTRSAELFLGYTDPALDAESFLPGGWFRTGDIGRLDADGFLTVTDRKKDIIVRGGENISSKEVEDVLALHPAVAEAAAVGVPDERYGERVCAFVVLREAGGSLDLDEVGRHFAAVGVARQKTPERLVVVDELPRTPAGKLRKHQLRVHNSDR